MNSHKLSIHHVHCSQNNDVPIPTCSSMFRSTILRAVMCISLSVHMHATLTEDEHSQLIPASSSVGPIVPVSPVDPAGSGDRGVDLKALIRAEDNQEFVEKWRD